MSLKRHQKSAFKTRSWHVNSLMFIRGHVGLRISTDR